MSIYSGFPTRKDESNYNHLLEQLIRQLQTDLFELMRQLKQMSAGHRLSSHYAKIIVKMRQMEEHKYLKPKFSEALTLLANYVGIPDKLETIYQRQNSRGTFSSQKDKHRNEVVSTSHSKFNTKKHSHVPSLHSHDDFDGKDGKFQTNHGFGRKHQTPKTQKQFRTTKTTIKQGNEGFYAIHERKMRKMNHVYQRKMLQRQDNKSAQNTKFRSVTEPEPYSSYNQFPKQMNCIDLKVLKEAKQQLKKGEKSDRFYRITEQVVFPGDGKQEYQ